MDFYWDVKDMLSVSISIYISVSVSELSFSYSIYFKETIFSFFLMFKIICVSETQIIPAFLLDS